MANGGSSGASRRESMDRGSSTFSPSLSEQYKNKAAAVNAAAGAGWPTSYGALGAGKSYFFFHVIFTLALKLLYKGRDQYNLSFISCSPDPIASSESTNTKFSVKTTTDK